MEQDIQTIVLMVLLMVDTIIPLGHPRREGVRVGMLVRMGVRGCH